MTDLELTKLCAEAMGYNTSLGITYMDESTGKGAGDVIIFSDHTIYRPLHDDAQAMALVKKFNLNICNPFALDLNPGWEVYNDGVEGVGGTEGQIIVVNLELNRAIVECVAKMQSAK